MAPRVWRGTISRQGLALAPSTRRQPARSVGIVVHARASSSCEAGPNTVDATPGKATGFRPRHRRHTPGQAGRAPPRPPTDDGRRGAWPRPAACASPLTHEGEAIALDQGHGPAPVVVPQGGRGPRANRLPAQLDGQARAAAPSGWLALVRRPRWRRARCSFEGWPLARLFVGTCGSCMEQTFRVSAGRGKCGLHGPLGRHGPPAWPCGGHEAQGASTGRRGAISTCPPMRPAAAPFSPIRHRRAPTATG